jgi:alkylation response protein AidB-like acyl-CoA dehydrogenase
MDFSLSEEQRAWQMKARKFADEEITPISLAREQIDLIADWLRGEWYRPAQH